MTLLQALLLGLAVLYVGFERTEAWEDPNYDVQPQSSRGGSYNHDPTPAEYELEQLQTEEPEHHRQTVKDESEKRSTTIASHLDQNYQEFENPSHVQTLPEEDQSKTGEYESEASTTIASSLDQNYQESESPLHTRTLARNITPSPDAPIDVRIVVTGRSGYGVSSTIRELIGKVTKCEMPEGETLQDIYEYTISDIPGTDSSIKLLDLPGFVDGRTQEKEAQILASLKSYISNTSDGQPPDFFLALSGFDDNRFVGVHSLFVQFLKRIELFELEFLRKVSGRNMNIVFLLTKMMSETKTNQRRPANKINTFSNVIRDYTLFPPPYQIVVGDNHAHSEHNAKIEGGYYRLPNKQHYPKNIWDAMINSSTSGEDDARESQVRAVLTAIRDNRETEMKCKAELIRTDWSEYTADADAFLYLLHHLKNLTIKENEVNQKIQEVFDNFPKTPDQRDGIIQKTALQLNLQNENITNKTSDIPKSHADRAEFFQKSSVISSTYAAILLIDSFKLEMPDYINPPTVGYGYDALADELTLETPFMNVKSLPSPIGYRMPNFMNCKRFPIHDIQTFQSYAQNVSEYFTERLKHLKFTTEGNITVTSFTGKAKAGYNMAPEEGVSIATLTAAKEIRTLKCVIAEKESWGELNEEFVETISSLEPVNNYNRDSVRDWTSFFGKYGTHIVVQGYGGGSLVGSMAGPNVKRVFESDDPSAIDKTLNSILKFTPFSIEGLEKPSYQLFGGEIEEGNQLYGLQEDQRDSLLRKWEQSLNSNFEMLKYEFTLERISTIIKGKIGERTGEMVDMAIELALKGELKHQKRRSKPSSSNKNAGTRATRRPTSTTTTTTQSSVDPVVGGNPLTGDAHQNTENYPPTTVTTKSSSLYDPGFYPGNQEDTDPVDTYLEDMRKRMKEQREREAAAAQERLNILRQINEAAETRHQEVLKGLRKWSEIDEKYQKECVSFKKIYHRCWNVENFVNYLGGLLYNEKEEPAARRDWEEKDKPHNATNDSQNRYIKRG